MDSSPNLISFSSSFFFFFLVAMQDFFFFFYVFSDKINPRLKDTVMTALLRGSQQTLMK